MAISEPSIFDDLDDEAEALAMEEAEDAVRSGRVISHEAMKAWLRSWGTDRERLPPQIGD